MYVRAQIAFAFDTTLPRDALVITPHYSTSAAQPLADTLLANLKANAQVGASRPFTVSIYPADAPSPGGPLATATNPGATPTASCPREVALCLSYYAIYNRPTFRGRLYIPATLLGSSVTARPSGPQRTAAAGFADSLGKNLPSGSALGVWSRKKSSFAQATDWWVDDEWDTVRSRGMKATTRTTGKF